MRNHGTTGRRRPPKRARAIRFADVMTGVVPVHPLYVDYLAHLGGQWQMLGNDVAGDCVGVTWSNFRRLITATLTNATNYPSQSQVWQVYQTQNPQFNPNGGNATGPGSQYDDGMDIQTLLEYLHGTGGPDGVKVLAFASVDLKNAQEVDAAIATCGALWTGINVYQNNYDEFDAEQPWDFVPGAPLVGGHSVLTGGYGTTVGLSSSVSGDEKFITWAEETSFTDNYWSNAVEEGWAVIWPEQLGTRSFEQGIDQAALAAAYQQITGKPLVL